MEQNMRQNSSLMPMFVSEYGFRLRQTANGPAVIGSLAVVGGTARLGTQG
jgi:hypothetical protein